MLRDISHFFGFDKFFPAPYDMLFVVVAAIALFFAIRELNCWYWKINKQVKILEKIEENINKHQNL